MKSLHVAFIFTCFLAPHIFTSQTACAGDLPETVRVTNLSTNVEIFDVVDAKIRKQGYTAGTPSSLPTLKAVVEITLSVEGNICGDSPESLAVKFVRRKGADAPEYNVMLSTTGEYTPDPWGIPEGCLTYARRSEVVIPVAFEWVDYEGSSATRSYFFETQDNQEVRVVLEATKASNGRKKIAISINDNP